MQEIVIVVSEGVVQEVYASDPTAVQVVLRRYDDRMASVPDGVREFPVRRLAEDDKRRFAEEQRRRM